MSILSQLIASIFKSESSGDPFYADTYAILNLQGANNSTVITDDAANPATYTTFGGATLKTDQFIFGSSSLYCDGVDDYVERNSLLTSPTGTWTIEGWFRPDENSTTFGSYGGISVFANENSFAPGQNIRGVGYFNPSVNDFRTVWGGIDDNGYTMVKLNINLIANTWYYYIVTSNQSANTFTFSVSEAGGPLQTVSAAYATNYRTLTFRCLGKAAGNRFKGYIGPTRITLNVARPHVVPTDLFYTPPIIPSQTFAYTGYLESFTVPSGVTSLNVNMWGAGGGSGGDSGGGSNSRGGAGGFLKFTSAVTPGEILTAQVGGGGLKGAAGDQVRKPGTGGGMTSLVRGDPFYSDVSLLLHMNGTNNSQTFTDDGNYRLSPSVIDGAKITTSTSKFGGGSAQFQLGDYLAYDTSSAFVFGTDDFTIEMWVYAQNTYGSIYDSRPFVTDGNYVALTFLSSTLTLTVNGSALITSSTPLPQGDWVHIALSRSNGTTRLYQNGVIVGSASDTTNYANAAGRPIIGRNGYDTTYTLGKFAGFIDEFRITKGTARYVAAFTPPSAAFSDPQDQYFDNNSLLLHFNGTNGGTTFTDNSANPNSFTLNGSPITSTTQVKYGSASGYFNGSSWLQLGANMVLSGNYTIEGWIYTSVNFFRVADNGGIITSLGHGGNGSILGSYIKDGSNTYINVAGTPVNTWYHFAAVQNGDAMTVYINGVASGGASTPGGKAATIRDIGRYDSPYGSYNFTGYLDDLRLTNGVARYTANFNPPNSQFADGNGIVAIVGAGGGGGGYGNGNQFSWGGSGGGTTANPGGDTNSIYATGGGAGTPTVGGTVGTPGIGLNGSYLQGGAGAGYTLGTQNSGGWPNGGNAVIIDERGGGGGGGYYGGGGGGGDGTWGAGGGGGSSYTGTGVTAITHAKATQNTVTAPGNTETGYVAGVADGGQNFNNGGNGLIYIGWTAPTGIVARYWRINATANNGSLYVSVGEMFLVNDSVDLDTSGKVYTASADIGSTYGPAGAFNGNINTSTYWAASASVTQWLQIDMGTEVVVDQIDIGMSTSANPAESPRDFSFQYSNDGTTWTVAKTFTNQTSWTLGVRRTFSIYP